jgi:hypothetical protein
MRTTGRKATSTNHLFRNSLAKNVTTNTHSVGAVDESKQNGANESDSSVEIQRPLYQYEPGVTLAVTHDKARPANADKRLARGATTLAKLAFKQIGKCVVPMRVHADASYDRVGNAMEDWDRSIAGCRRLFIIGMFRFRAWRLHNI